MIGTSLTVMASDNIPVLTLKENEYNSNDERHIKIGWEGNKGTYEIQIDDDSDFNSTITKQRNTKQGFFYNFVLNENQDATYYIRVRVKNGDWSNVVTASIKEIIESETPSYIPPIKFPVIPNISSSIKIPNIKFN